MAILEFELKDSRGVDADIGDEIEVVFPELEINNGGHGGCFYRPEFKARCKIYLYPSSGLKVKVLEILEIGEEADIPNPIYKPGQLLEFRRTTWKWHKL